MKQCRHLGTGDFFHLEAPLTQCVKTNLAHWWKLFYQLNAIEFESMLTYLKCCYASWVCTPSYQVFHTLTAFDAFNILYRSVQFPPSITAEPDIYSSGESEAFLTHHLQQPVKQKPANSSVPGWVDANEVWHNQDYFYLMLGLRQQSRKWLLLNVGIVGATDV